MRFSTKITALALAASAIAPMSPAAANEYVSNGGFESTTLTGSTPLFGPNTPATNWSSDGQWILFCSANPGVQCDQIGGPGLNPGTAPPSPQGGNFMGIDGTDGFNGIISQTIGGISAGQVLTLSFYMATSQEFNGTDPTTETLTATLGGESFTTPTIHTPGGGDTPWVLYSTTFTYDGSNNVLSFVNAGTGTPPYALIDGVSLQDAGVPEPGSWALMLAGFGALGFLARRRRAMAAAA